MNPAFDTLPAGMHAIWDLVSPLAVLWFTVLIIFIPLAYHSVCYNFTDALFKALLFTFPCLFPGWLAEPLHAITKTIVAWALLFARRGYGVRGIMMAVLLWPALSIICFSVSIPLDHQIQLDYLASNATVPSAFTPLDLVNVSTQLSEAFQPLISHFDRDRNIYCRLDAMAQDLTLNGGMSKDQLELLWTGGRMDSSAVCGRASRKDRLQNIKSTTTTTKSLLGALQFNHLTYLDHTFGRNLKLLADWHSALSKLSRSVDTLCGLVDAYANVPAYHRQIDNALFDTRERECAASRPVWCMLMAARHDFFPHSWRLWQHLAQSSDRTRIQNASGHVLVLMESIFSVQPTDMRMKSLAFKESLIDMDGLAIRRGFWLPSKSVKEWNEALKTLRTWIDPYLGAMAPNVMIQSCLNSTAFNGDALASMIEAQRELWNTRMVIREGDACEIRYDALGWEPYKQVLQGWQES